MSMFPNDPGHMEEQFERQRNRLEHLRHHGTGHSTSSLRVFDQIWDGTGFVLKVLTSPIWFPISWWKRRKLRLLKRDSSQTHIREEALLLP
jgi:hypothetical protein